MVIVTVCKIVCVGSIPTMPSKVFESGYFTMSKHWEIINDVITKILDSIDLISEMKDEEEDLCDFMQRLEKKYPFEYINEQSGKLKIISLFNDFDSVDFQYYLYKRYGYSKFFINTYEVVMISKNIK